MNISAEVFNEEFPLDRREALFSSASKDISDNTVACYRYIWWEINHILSQDVWDTSVINSWSYDCAEFAKKYIGSFLSSDKKSKYRGLYLVDTSPWDIISILKEILTEEFWADETELSDILSSHEKLMEFILERMPISETISRHRWYPTKFSPFMSWSIAWFSGYFLRMLSGSFNRQTVYIEAIIPDDELIYDDRQSWGEKEILTTQVKKEWISRVFTNRQQLIREIFSEEFEYCNIWLKSYTEAKEYALEIEANPFPLEKQDLNYSDIAEHWRFNTDTKLYLPKDMKIQNYDSKTTIPK